MPYDPSWEDMSDYLVHFTKPTDTSTCYSVMMTILGTRMLKARRAFGLAREQAPIPQSQYTVCFSEVPLHQLGRLATRRSDYGIGFTKEYISGKGGLPIWYLRKDSVALQAAFQLLNRAKAATNPENDPIWTLTPFIDASGDYGASQYRFEWEREWRHVGDLSFSENDVSFLILPEHEHMPVPASSKRSSKIIQARHIYALISIRDGAKSK